jgi:histidine triad (HIT) family protein
MSDCLFCKIDSALAFNDITPQAPVHVLVIPKEHITSADHIVSAHGGIVDELVMLAQRVADVKGVRESGYRLVMNVGVDANMSVPHLHMHVLGGRRMEWPPG